MNNGMADIGVDDLSHLWGQEIYDLGAVEDSTEKIIFCSYLCVVCGHGLNEEYFYSSFMEIFYSQYL